MYQLTLSLQIILGEITAKQVSTRNLVARIFAVFSVVIYGALATFVELYKGFNFVYYLRIPYFFILSSFYIFVIILLNVKMQ